VRELSNGIARFVLIGTEAAIKQDHLQKRNASATEAGAVPLKNLAKSAIKDLERNVILEALRAHQWNRRRTAQSLKISYRSLIYKIRDAGLVSRKTVAPSESRPPA
jgi:two-component system response regulator AtoC